MPVKNPKEFWQEVRHAEEYERVRFSGVLGNLYKYLEERALQKACAGFAKGSRVLDVPVGTGRITSLLVRAGHKVVASDIALPMMIVAKNKLNGDQARVPFLQGDIHCLPFPSHSFDAVMCIGLLMHQDTTGRLKTLQELSRVAKGPLVLQYGCTSGLLMLKTRLTGRNPGDVRFTVTIDDVMTDLAQCDLVELSRSWVLRPFSSSLILVAGRRHSR